MSEPITDDSQEMMNVFETRQESEAMVIQGLLDSAGIESMVTSDIGARDVLPLGTIVVRVARAEAESAKNVIGDFQTNPSDVEAAEEDAERNP